MNITRHTSHEQFASVFAVNRNVARNVCNQSALTCPHSTEMPGVRVLRYRGSADGKWVVEIHDTTNSDLIRDMWAKRFHSPRASLKLFTDITSELVKYYVGASLPSDPAEFIAEAFNLEPV